MEKRDKRRSLSSQILRRHRPTTIFVLWCLKLACTGSSFSGIQLIVHPELSFDFFLPQYHASLESLDLTETVLGATTEIFSQKAKEFKVVIILNLFDREGDRTYDSSQVVNSDGEIVGKTRRVHIVEALGFLEKCYYAFGNPGVGVFDTVLG